MPQTEDAFRLIDSAEARTVLRISKSQLNKLVKRGTLRRSIVSRSLFPWSEIQRIAKATTEPRREVTA